MAARVERRGERTRTAILGAAAAVFAEHGYDGARIDAIAEASSCNKALIFRYFGDKLGLYAAVLKLVDDQARELQVRLLAPLLEDQAIVVDARRFRAFLAEALREYLDFALEHTNVTRMMAWEQAEGWKASRKLAALYEVEGLEQLEALFASAQSAGILRTKADPFFPFLLAEHVCWSYPGAVPLFQLILPGRDFSSSATRARVRDEVVDFVVGGILADPRDVVLEDDFKGDTRDDEPRGGPDL